MLQKAHGFDVVWVPSQGFQQQWTGPVVLFHRMENISTDSSYVILDSNSILVNEIIS